jgi:hypothetical protein
MRSENTKVIIFDTLLLEQHLTSFCDVLIDTVEDGAAVSFLAPLSRSDAERFWTQEVKLAVGNGAKLLFGALVEEKVVAPSSWL